MIRGHCESMNVTSKDARLLYATAYTCKGEAKQQNYCSRKCLAGKQLRGNTMGVQEYAIEGKVSFALIRSDIRREILSPRISIVGSGSCWHKINGLGNLCH